MKLLQLELFAYGPFTDRSLDFSAGEQGLHLVYGPNEAGKSSALRALKALFYGIPERTADNFLHPNESLRVGGRLRAATGSEFRFRRRKGRRNTLLDEEEAPLDERLLADFLQGVGRGLFDTLFGIDHEGLLHGGREILEGKGEVGPTLFSAGLGSSALHDVVKVLDAEAQELFSPRGSRPLINKAIAEFRDTKKRVSDSSLPVHLWDEQEKRLAEINDRVEKGEAHVRRLNAEVTRLDRLKSTLGMLSRRRALKESLASMGDVIVLAEDFSKRRRETLNGLETARQLLTRTRAQRARLQKEAEVLRLDEAVLDRANVIESLKGRLGSHRKAASDRVHLLAERGELLTRAQALLDSLRPGAALHEAAAELRPMLNRRGRIQALGNRHQALDESVVKARKTMIAAEQTLAEVERRLTALPAAEDPSQLQRAVTAAHRAGDLDEVCAEVSEEVSELENRCDAVLAQLGPWKGRLDGLLSLAVPAMEAIERFEENFRCLEDEAREMEKARESRAEELRNLRRDLDALRLSGDVPGEETLQAGRARREKGWQLIRRQWLLGEDISSEAADYDPHVPLPEAFEASVQAADEIADRLRREAEKVHRKAALVADEKAAFASAAELERCASDHRRRWREAQEAWASLWHEADIEPLPPREMRGWRLRFDALREHLLRLRMLRARLQRLETFRRQHCEELVKALSSLGETGSMERGLRDLLSRGENRLEVVQARESDRQRLKEEAARQRQLADQLRLELEEALRAQREWHQQWGAALKETGLDAAALPLEANDFLDRLGHFFDQLDAAAKLSLRIEAIDADAASFREEVTSLAGQIGPDLAGQSLETTVERLSTALQENLERKARLDENHRRDREVEEELRAAVDTVEDLEARLENLCREARCAGPQGLEEVERASAEFLRATADLRNLEGSLHEVGGGISLEVLEREAEAVDADALGGEIDHLRRELEEGEAELREAHGLRGRLKSELDAMRRAEGAGEAAERSQEILAELDRLVRRYLRVRLAGLVLRQEIERYRERHQGPLTARASEYFAGLTCGSFKGLRTDYDDWDKPVLVGVRPDDRITRIEGMSSGTRDQLYLALRLATLEAYAVAGESLPFIVDDILINFDDARTAATIEALAELSDKTQVILFTHHSRVVEHAQRLSQAERIFVHFL